MKALFIGGTGIISSDITELLLQNGWDVTLLNRGSRSADFPKARHIACDIYREEEVAKLLDGQFFDVVADFIVFDPEAVQRDIRLFSGRTRQYIFISSAAAYRKPPASLPVTESTILANPCWDYAQKKAQCEEILLNAYRQTGFPFTVVRPSHTFSKRSLPLPIHGAKGPYQVLLRMLEGKKVPVLGSGESLWTITPSRDFAMGFLGLMGNPAAIGECVHITLETPMTWNRIMQCIADTLHVPYRPCYVSADLMSKSRRYDFTGPLVSDKGVSLVFDNSKIKRFSPAFPSRNDPCPALRESVLNIMSDPALQIPDPEFDAFCDGVVRVMEQAENAIADL